MKFCRFLFFITFFLFDEGSLSGLVKGSTTVLSIEDHIVFPGADSNNTIIGFTWFKNGFTLEDATTACTFDAETYLRRAYGKSLMVFIPVGGRRNFKYY